MGQNNLSEALSFYALNKPQQAEVASFYKLYLLCFDDDPTRKWSQKGFEEILSLEGVAAHLCARGDSLSGFIIWRVTCDESEILNIGVAATDRQKGMGASLLNGMIARMEKEKIAKIFLEVREGNVEAKALYNNCGFKVTGRRKAYYSHQDGGREDAVIMTKLL